MTRNLSTTFPIKVNPLIYRKSCHVQEVYLEENKIYSIEKEMEQTRVKDGHIELVQGSNYTKLVKLML